MTEAAWTQFRSALRRKSLAVSAETETCRGATYRKRNQAETELFTNFGTETETETEIQLTSKCVRLTYYGNLLNNL